MQELYTLGRDKAYPFQHKNTNTYEFMAAFLLTSDAVAFTEYGPQVSDWFNETFYADYMTEIPDFKEFFRAVSHASDILLRYIMSLLCHCVCLPSLLMPVIRRL